MKRIVSKELKHSVMRHLAHIDIEETLEFKPLCDDKTNAQIQRKLAITGAPYSK